MPVRTRRLHRAPMRGDDRAVAFRTVADDGNDALIIGDVHALDLAAVELVCKRVADDLRGARRNVAGHRDTDRVLRAGLRNQRY